MRLLLTAVAVVSLAIGGFRFYENHISARSENGLSGNLLGLVSQGLQKGKAAAQAGYAPTENLNDFKGAIHYSPWENLEHIDIKVIESSRCRHLDIAAYSFTDQEIARAVVAFANSGRKVRIYRDREQYEQESRRNSYVATLFHGNPNISIRVKGSKELMHIKGFTDLCLVREGSANWSPSGEKSQDNTLTLSTDKKSVADFEAVFEAMWARSNNIVIQ
jgi:hypothetical protein